VDRAPEYQAHQGLTLYFLGKLHSGLKKLSAYYRQRGVTVFNIASPAELGRAYELRAPHALVVDLQSREEITAYLDALSAHEGLLELPRVAIISSNADEETAETLRTQCDAHVSWPLKATDLSRSLFELLLARDHFVRLERDEGREEGEVYRGALGPTTLRDLVQLIYLGRRDCILGLECEGRRGNLFFKEGRLIDAQVGALEWKDSLVLVRRFRRGTFTLTFQPVERKQFIERSVTAWLLQEPEPGPEPQAPEPEEVTAVGARPVRGEGQGAEEQPSDAGLAPPPAVPTPRAEPAEGAGVGWSPDPLMPPPPPGPGESEREEKGITSSVPVGAPAVASLATSGGSSGGVVPAEEGPEETDRRSRAALLVALFLLVVVGGVFLVRSFREPEPVAVVHVTTPTPQPPPVVRATPAPVAKPAAPTPTLRPTPAPRRVTPSPIPSPVKPTPVKATPRPVPRPTPAPVKVAKVVVPEVPRATPAPVRIPVPKTTPVPERIEPTPAPTPGAPPPTTPPAAQEATPEPVQVAKVIPPAEQPITMESVSRVLPDRNLRKARELEKAGKLQEALAVYTQVAELDPTSREASEAIERLKGAAEVNPNAPAELHINSFPYGIVYVDGEKYGYTPVHLNKVVPRKYLIRVVNPELGACSTEVVVKPGERKWVHLRLDDEESCKR